MKKRIEVIDVETNKSEVSVEFNGTYNIAYSRYDDDGILKFINKLDNGRFTDKLWIMNYRYKEIAEAIKDHYKEEFKHINADHILFLEDTEWHAKNSMKRKQKWIARIAKASSQFEAMTGYCYILTTRRHYTENMQPEQMAALLYHEMRHVAPDGSLDTHDVDDWGNMVATLGADWATTRAMIPDILDKDFQFKELKRSQLSMFDTNVVSFPGRGNKAEGE